TNLADISIFTSEDPRNESIQNIFAQMYRGIKKDAATYKIPDRGEAINFSINKLAKIGDIVVICGKGHEKSMNFNGIEYPWSDKKSVISALRNE
ncbi:MAG: UDP-N-acetylmuramoyl-L-alanyl-D-glutamate--2,6-diaminopimelate ligase, partial [Patescibacteria group bacterium]